MNMVAAINFDGRAIVSAKCNQSLRGIEAECHNLPASEFQRVARHVKLAQVEFV